MLSRLTGSLLDLRVVVIPSDVRSKPGETCWLYCALASTFDGALVSTVAKNQYSGYMNVNKNIPRRHSIFRLELQLALDFLMMKQVHDCSIKMISYRAMCTRSS